MTEGTIAGVPTWALAAAAGSAVLLIVVIILAWPRKKKSLQRTRPTKTTAVQPPHPSAGALLKIDFSETAAVGLRTLNSTAGSGHGRYIDGLLVLMGGENTRTREEAPIEGGQAVRFSYRARVIKDGVNGSPQNYFVGPLMLDNAGNIIGWWSERPPAAAADGYLDGVLDFVAPAGSKSMALGVASSFHADQPPSDAMIEFISAWVKRID
jgi:hypothetical protein